jgi:hypothetical protein
MTDKELLERAALAAGIAGSWGHEGYLERREGFIRDGWRRAWEPNRRSEDAFELLVAMRFELSIEPSFVVVITEDCKEVVEYGADRRLAACIAITKAAAAMATEEAP